MAKSLTKAARRTTAGKALTRATAAATTRAAPARVLTVVARDPARSPPTTDDELHDGNGDGQIGDVLDRLRKRNRSHTLRRAASVGELAKVLIDYQAGGDRPELIQIIGHGDAGVIWLGKGAWGDPPEADGRIYLLDSNQATYGALRRCIPRTCTVLLFGCNVGEAVPETSGDGPILLFDIAHTFGCEVRAPVDPVYRGDLDRWGRFRNDRRHREMLSTVKDDVLTVGTSLRRPASKGPPPRPVFRKLLRSSCRFGRVLVDIDLTQPIVLPAVEGPPVTADLRPIAIDLARAIGGEALEEPILAAPGFVFEILEGEVPGKAEVLANGAFIRLTTGHAKPRVFHTRSESAFRELLERLAVLLRLLPR